MRSKDTTLKQEIYDFVNIPQQLRGTNRATAAEYSCNGQSNLV